MPERDYKIGSALRGRIDTEIIEFVTHDDGSKYDEPIMSLLPGTPPETKADIVEALRKAYQAGRQDRSKELAAGAIPDDLAQDIGFLIVHDAIEGIHALIKERRRQIIKGYDAAHDDSHDSNEMLSQSAVQLDAVGAGESQYPLSDLARSGALIAAELDRIDRMIKRGRGHS